MALSATFTANFSSFYDAVDKADAKLKDFGEGADKVGRRLDTLSNQFSGRALVQEATVMAKAVEEIGGVSKLTEKELARLGATTNEAVAKMKALGMDVPANLQKIADQTKNANKASIDWVGTLTKVASTIGIAFSVDAVVSFARSVFDAAGAVKDLSDQWGVSTKAVQQWTQAARLSGVESETVGKSVQFVTDKLGENSDAYVALLANVGLSASKLRAMSIEDAYKEIIKAIGGIKDEVLQFDAAQALIGPSAKKMVGAIRDGFLEAADAQKVMSDETIKRLEAAGDAWGSLKDKVVIFSGEMLAAVMKDTGTITKSWGNFFTAAALGLRDTLAGTTGSAQGFLAARGAMDDYNATTKKAADIQLSATSATKGHNNEIKTAAQVLADLALKNDRLKKAEQDRAAALAAGKKIEDDYNRSLAAYQKSLDDLNATWSGADLVEKAALYTDALQYAIPIQQMSRKAQDDINKVMVDAIGAYVAVGDRAPQAMYDIELATRKMADATLEAGKNLTFFLDKSLTLGAPTMQLGAAPPPPGMFDGMAKGLAASMSSSVLKAIQGGGNIFAAAGSSIGNFILDPKQSGVGKAIESSAKKLPGLIGGAIGSAIPFVGSFIGPAIGWLSNKISSWFGKKEHEKLRDSFIESAGGLKMLRKEADDAGVSLQKLFTSKNSDQVKGAIAELQAAFEFQEHALDAAKEAAERYGFTLEELGPALSRQKLDDQAQQLYKDFEVLNAAGIDSVAITTRMSEAVSKYVQDAIKMGGDVPAAMRPMLEAFAKAGTLVDENGDSIGDLEAAGVSFTMSMSEGFRTLIDEVHNLTDAIERSLTQAINNVPPVTVPVQQDPLYGHFGHAGFLDHSYAEGTGGFKNFGAGTPAMLHGWEAVVPRDEAAAFATVAGGGGGAMGGPAAAPTIIINANNSFFDTPGDLQRLADRVDKALSARHALSNRRRAA